MERRLGPPEQAMYWLDHAAPIHFVMAGRLSGPLDEPLLRAALVQLRQRHPLLRARIVRDEAGEPAFRPGGAELALRLAPGADWAEEAGRELNQRLPAEAGPLLRCAAIAHGPAEHTVLLSVHHSIGDGMSGAYLLRDLARALAGLARDPGFALEPLSDTRPLDQRVPAAGRSGGGRRFLLREASRTLRWGQPLKLPHDRWVPAAERRAHVLARALDAPTAARLAERARAEGATVHGALAAAMLLAVVDDARPARPARVAFGSPVNLRKHMEPAAGEDLGFFVSMAAFGARVGPGQALWPLARAIRAELVADQEAGLAWGAVGMVGGLVRLLQGRPARPEVLALRAEKLLAASTGLTNLGRLEIETDFGSHRLEAVHLLANPTASGDWIATACSLHGRLSWNFIWSEPLLTAEHARALSDGALDRLLRACEA